MHRPRGRHLGRSALSLSVIIISSLARSASAAPAPSDLRSRAVAAGLGSLKTVPAVLPPNAKRFVVDPAKVTVLGKALFWDQQIGSDGNACASCHYHAGADNRRKNQLNPGFRNQRPPFAPPSGDTVFGNSPLGTFPRPAGWGANYELTALDFPLHKLVDPVDRTSAVLSDTNDVVSSQGVFNATFPDTLNPGDSGAVFTVSSGGQTYHVRNVEPRNTPTVINAVFNLRNFWDGRARKEMNAVNPIGKLDPTARIVFINGASKPVLLPVNIPFASLGSQANGPPTSDLEMSFRQRRNADIGRKMLSAATVPLASQLVDKNDSLLGPFSLSPANGVNFNAGAGPAQRYADLVKKAFDRSWWDGAAGWVVDVSSASGPTLVKGSPGPDRYTVMEWNWSLYFGVAYDYYESTLVADDTPFDRFMGGADGALTADQLSGLDLFIGNAKCSRCHGGAELTNASVRNAGNEPIERMIMGNDRIAVYDNGFYNIGVRFTLEDIGVGATIGPKNLPLSDSRRYQDCVRDRVAAGSSVRDANAACGVPRIPARPSEARILLGRVDGLVGGVPGVAQLLAAADAALLANAIADASADLVSAAGLLSTFVTSSAVTGLPADLLAEASALLPDPVDPGPDPAHPFGPPLSPGERVAADGALKVPGLRNVEHTAPYFHNGGQASLAQVVAFYNRGGDFAIPNQDDLDPDIQPLGLSDVEQGQIVSFLRALTDARVVKEQAPFDHPSLDVANGGTPGVLGSPYFPAAGNGVLDDRLKVPACGKDGQPANQLGDAHTVFADFLDPLN
jgi:cytochrome c peroxidase